MSVRKEILKECSFVLGVFLLALNYNIFLLPNNLVTGGTSGLSIILKPYISPTIFIYGATIVLLIISFIFLGKDMTKNTVLGSILYPIFVSLSEPLAKLLLPYFVFDEYIITIGLSALLYGFSNGVIFRTGYTTGGFDVIANIITKYLKIPTGKALFMANSVVIAFGGFTFGLGGVVYALIILYVGSTLTNKLVIGVSESKIFFIYTKETDKVKEFIVDVMKTGYTVLPTVGGYSKHKGEMIMCVIYTKDYYKLKEEVLSIDKNAFIVVNDCYDVNGGVKKESIPFI